MSAECTAKQEGLDGFSIVIPLHNEAGNVAELCSRVLQAMKNRPVSWELILIDDGSTDGTIDELDLVANLFREERERLVILHKQKREGQAKAIESGIRNANFQNIVRMDGDLQDSPEDLGKFVEKMQAGHDLVVGVRNIRAHPRFQRFMSSIFDAFAILFLNSPFHASVASFVSFKRFLLVQERFSRQTNRWMVLIALRNGAKNPAEVFVEHFPRASGQSKYNQAVKAVEASIGATFFFAREWLRPAIRRRKSKVRR